MNRTPMGTGRMPSADGRQEVCCKKGGEPTDDGSRQAQERVDANVAQYEPVEPEQSEQRRRRRAHPAGPRPASIARTQGAPRPRNARSTPAWWRLITTAASSTTRTEFHRRPVARIRCRKPADAHRAATAKTLLHGADGVVDVRDTRAWGARRRRATSRARARRRRAVAEARDQPLVKARLPVDLGARAVLDRRPLRADRRCDPVAVPAGGERLGPKARVEAVEAVLAPGGGRGTSMASRSRSPSARRKALRVRARCHSASRESPTRTTAADISSMRQLEPKLSTSHLNEVPAPVKLGSCTLP